MKRAKATRERAQIVIALGENETGWALKGRLVAAAEQQGLTVSAWARRVLSLAAGELADEPPTRREFERLEERVVALEEKLEELEADAVDDADALDDADDQEDEAP